VRWVRLGSGTAHRRSRHPSCGGLPEGNSDAFFTPFGARRGKDRTSLGLGLNISRKAVKAFGGEILVRNLPGKGCVFTIALPAAV
jgi:C4-dicarboxylate-specific signal transduction histidine kinase